MAAWDDKTATAGDNLGGVNGAAGAASTVPGGSAMGSYAGEGTADNDGDGDDVGASNGTAAGHADVVPSGAGWPAIQQ